MSIKVIFFTLIYLYLISYNNNSQCLKLIYIYIYIYIYNKTFSEFYMTKVNIIYKIQHPLIKLQVTFPNFFKHFKQSREI